MIWAVAKRPGWPEDRCYTDVLTEDVNSGEAFSYTGICECGVRVLFNGVPAGTSGNRW